MTTPGETDLYTFSLASPQVLYLDAQGDCGGTLIRWALLGSDGAQVPSDAGIPDSAACFDLGTYSLPAGNYTVGFRTTDGPAPTASSSGRWLPTQTFPIAVGQTVSTGQPAAGAGEITTPGEVDYTFSLGSLQTVVLDALGDCSGKRDPLGAAPGGRYAADI